MPRPAPDDVRKIPPEPAEQPTLGPWAGTEPRPSVPVAPPPGYEILRELGRGGMGVVYEARQLGLNRRVALKMILSGAHAGETDLGRFRAEAEILAQLRHPNVVQVHDVGEHNGIAFFVLEYCEGGSLEDRLRGMPLPPCEAAALVEKLARAVQAAHQLGIVHRDLKLANVLLDADDTPKITDFGLAKRLGREAGQTVTGAVMGTPSYMAPEQAGGKAKEIGPASDVYGLGAVLYALVTGRPPFVATSHMDTILQVLSELPLPPRLLQPRLPRDLETVCLKCLEKDPARRYGSAEELADDLLRFLAGEPVRARRPSVLTQAWYWARRPERIRDAGIIQLVIMALSIPGYLLGTVGVIQMLTATPSLREQWEFLLRPSLLMASRLLGVWIGFRTLARKGSAVWLGLCFWLGLLSLEVYDLLAVYNAGLSSQAPMGQSLRGNFWQAWLARTMAYDLFPLLCYGVALYAYYVHREPLPADVTEDKSEETPSADLRERG